MTVLVGFADRGNDLYNAAAILRDGGAWHLPQAFLAQLWCLRRGRYFRPATSATSFVIDGVTVGVNL